LTKKIKCSFCSFICWVASARTPGEREETFADFESSCHLLLHLSNHSKVETIQANLPSYLHTIPLMLNGL